MFLKKWLRYVRGKEQGDKHEEITIIKQWRRSEVGFYIFRKG